ncbi:RNA polymerase sigma-70 factor [uncultured Phocaeicola sp.]|jgi:RNA polymerase sigma-70 factor (ECF subfamily)|uniref:RNA polymerase sigma-70 factor n=1 Tax=uncultured Phocaeicola sp. TaxID=990718 RepID=UPI0025F72720|nr:RNA polymerase sigma-70 factor [uncultured Phocaeicola sp.]
MGKDRKETFKTRFLTHYPRLCRIAYGYVLDTDDAEDIVQELFIHIWNKDKDTLPEAEFIAYMTTAVRNSCINFLRKRPDDTVSIEENPALTSCMPEENEEENVSSEERLQKALAVLPPKCRDIFLLAKLKGMKYREIAEQLAISEKTVENQMSKAIRLLRTYAASCHPLLIVWISIFVSTLQNYIHK